MALPESFNNTMHSSTISRPLNRRGTRALAIAALAALPFALIACADDGSAGDTTSPDTQTDTTVSEHVTLESGWAKAADGMSGVFGTLSNPTDEDVTLTSAASSRAGLVELHETVMVDGQLMMREIEGGFEIPAGESRELIPGEDHIMLMELDSELLPGEVLPLTLEFSNGDVVEIDLDVREYAGANENYEDLEHHHDHEGDHTHE